MVNIEADEHGGGDAGQQVLIRRWRRCGTATEDMWDDGYGEMGWNNGNGLGKYLQGTTTNLRAYRHSDNLGVGATMDLHVYSGFIWRLCVLYCNLNKITRCFKYPSWSFDNVIIHPGRSKNRITKGERKYFCTTTSVMCEFQYRE